MWFIASFLTALGAAYVYEKYENRSVEIATACVAVALASIVLTLVAAPWPIQLLLVVLALFSYRFTNTRLFN